MGKNDRLKGFYLQQLLATNAHIRRDGDFELTATPFCTSYFPRQSGMITVI